MTDERFWKIADKFQGYYDTNMGIETYIKDDEAVLCNLAYYDKGDYIMAEADLSLLYDHKATDSLRETLKNRCEYYNLVGAKEFKKTCKKAFTNKWFCDIIYL